MVVSYTSKNLNTFVFHRLVNIFLKTDVILFKPSENIFFVNPQLEKNAISIFHNFLQGCSNYRNRESLLSFFSFSRFFTSGFFSSRLLGSQNLEQAFWLQDVSKCKVFDILFTQKTKFEFVFWVKFIKKLYFDATVNELLLEIDPFKQVENSFVKQFSGKFFKKTNFTGRSFKDFQTNVRERIYDFVKRHRIKKRSKLLTHLFDVNVDFFKAKESRLPLGIRGVIPYKYVSKKKASSYIFWHMEKFYNRFLVKMLKLTKTKKTSLKGFKFLRNLNFFKAKKKSKNGNPLKKNQFLSEASFAPIPDNRLQLLARYRQSVKFFYLLKKVKNKKTFIKSGKDNLKSSTKNVFNFLFWCNILKKQKKDIVLLPSKINILLKSGYRFLKFFRRNRQLFKFKKFDFFFNIKKNNTNSFLKKLTKKTYAYIKLIQKNKKNRVKSPLNFAFKNFGLKLKNRIQALVLGLPLKKSKFKFSRLFNFKNTGAKSKKRAVESAVFKPSFYIRKIKNENLSFFVKKSKTKSFLKKNSRAFFYKPSKKQILSRYIKNSNYKTEILPLVAGFDIDSPLLPLKKTFFTLNFLFSQVRPRLERLVLGYSNQAISNYVSKVFYPTVDTYPQNSYKKIEAKPTILSFSSRLNKLITTSSKFFGCFKNQQLLNTVSGLLNSSNCSLFNLKFFDFLEVGFLSLINFNNFNLILNDRFAFYLQNLIYYKRLLNEQLVRYDFYRQYWENLTHPEFSLNKNKKSPFISPGMIIFTLNASSVFLTVLNNAGHTVFQTSTGAVNKKKYANEKFKKVVVRGYRARREVYKRMLQKMFKRLQAIRSKKTRRAKRKQLVGFVKKKGKKKRKGNKLRKLPKGKTFFLTFHVVRKMLSLLTPIVNYMQTYISHNSFFKIQVLRKKLQLKLDKLKMSKKFNKKAFYLILRRLKRLNLKRKHIKRKKFRKAYVFIAKKQGHTYVQRRFENLMSFFPMETLKKKQIKELLLKRNVSKKSQNFVYNFKQKFFKFWLNQKKNKKEKLQFVLKKLCLLPFVKKAKHFKHLKRKQCVNFKLKIKAPNCLVLKKNKDEKLKDVTKLGKIFKLLSKKYNKDLFKILAQGRVSRKTCLNFSNKKLGRFHRWLKVQNRLKNRYQTWLIIKYLTAKHLARYLLLFKHIDGSMIRRAFKFLLKKFFEKLAKHRLAFDKKVTKISISSFFYDLIKKTKQRNNVSGINIFY